jgi:hypothetical protein
MKSQSATTKLIRKVAMLSAFDKANIGRIIAGYGDWFTAKLLRLIAEADVENRGRISIAFPEEVQAYENWYALTFRRELT